MARLARRPKVVIPVTVLVLVGFATVLGVADGLGVATFVVVVYTAIFSAVAVLGWRPFAALPELSVALHIGVETTASVQLPVYPAADIDVEACINERVDAARATISSPASAHPYAGLDPTVERYDIALARFNTELASYAAELRQWLEAYDVRRWPNYSIIRGQIAIENDGQSVADGVTLRLILPDGLGTIEDEEDLWITPPPEAPRFEQQNLLRMPIVPLHRIPIAEFPKISLPSAPSAVAGPELILDKGRVIVQFRVETVTHGVTALSHNPLLVMPDSPGTYVLPWEAHVGNLRHPARGSISIRVDGRPAEPFQLTTVAAVLATRDVLVLEG